MTHSLSGHLLVASSLVTDPTYAGGVCLVMHQDEEHTIGVMLNRPLRPTPDAIKAMFGDKATGQNRLKPQHDSTEDDPQTDISVSERDQEQGSDELTAPNAGTPATIALADDSLWRSALRTGARDPSRKSICRG